MEKILLPLTGPFAWEKIAESTSTANVAEGINYRHRIRPNFHVLQALGTDRFCKYCSSIRNLSFLAEGSRRATLPDVVYEARPALNQDDRILGHLFTRQVDDLSPRNSGPVATREEAESIWVYSICPVVERTVYNCPVTHMLKPFFTLHLNKTCCMDHWFAHRVGNARRPARTIEGIYQYACHPSRLIGIGAARWVTTCSQAFRNMPTQSELDAVQMSADRPWHKCYLCGRERHTFHQSWVPSRAGHGRLIRQALPIEPNGCLNADWSVVVKKQYSEDAKQRHIQANLPSDTRLVHFAVGSGVDFSEDEEALNEMA